MAQSRPRRVDRLALPITRACNRDCPECPAHEKGGAHVPVEELKWVGETIGPIDKIEVTGGEPSIHPDFAEISENIHKWFDCKDIMLLTNGGIFSKDDNLHLLLKWDRVYITHYTDAFVATHGTTTNHDVHAKVCAFMGGHPEIPFWSQQMDCHVPLKPPLPWANGCRFGYDVNDMVSYYMGQIYGCCTSWQLEDRGRGIVLTRDWRDHIGEIVLPCGKCFLGAAVKK